MSKATDVGFGLTTALNANPSNPRAVISTTVELLDSLDWAPEDIVRVLECGFGIDDEANSILTKYVQQLIEQY
jgi:hypothetical protein